MLVRDRPRSRGAARRGAAREIERGASRRAQALSLNPAPEPARLLGRRLEADRRLDGTQLLGDGVPRSRRRIVAALAERYPRAEVVQALLRLAVTDQVVETRGKYTLVPAEAGSA